MPPALSRRIVLATFGSLGDLHPMLAIALALRRRGHRPLVAGTDMHRAAVEAEGLDFRVMRPGIAEFGDGPETMKRVMHLRDGAEFLIRDLLLPHLRASFDDLDAACDGADALLSHPVTFAAPLVAARRRAQGLAWASVVLAPSNLLSAHDPSESAAAPWLQHLRPLGPGMQRVVLRAIRAHTRPWMAPYDALRRELGLPDDKRHPLFDAPLAPELVLALFSPLLAAAQPDWPPQTVVTGFPWYDRGGSVFDPDAAADRDRLEAFLAAGAPPIVFTLGSAAVLDAGAFYAEGAEAARRLGHRALLLTGSDPRNCPPADAMSADIAAVGYAPHSAVFPRAAAIVHQGGIGTTAQALRSGRPMLVVPFGFDQPDNAARAVRLGVARTLPRARFRAGTATRALAALLDDATYAAQARTLGARIAAEDGAETAAEAIGRWLDAR